MVTVMSSGRSLYSVYVKEEDGSDNTPFVFVASSKEKLIENLKASILKYESPDAVNWIDWDNIKPLDRNNPEDVTTLLFAILRDDCFDADMLKEDGSFLTVH